MKNVLFLLLSLLALGSCGTSLNDVKNPKNAYTGSSLPTTIDLNDCTEEEVRSYYSSLSSLSASERKGTNLLKNLKEVLKTGQKYYSYDSGGANIWKLYAIADRDWDLSPASAISSGTYNPSTNIITGYVYGESKDNPYVHSLYTNREVANEAKAFGDHTQTNWGINREHVWPKSHGFDGSDKTGDYGARGDPMHLMAGNGYANNKHSNYFYGNVDVSKSYTDCGNTYSYLTGNLLGTSQSLGSGTVFEPQDSDKGDIARAVFYMVARYNYLSGSDSDGIDSSNPNLILSDSLSENTRTGSSTASNAFSLGVLHDLLEWHHADPVDDYEIHRNNLLYKNFTNNRNPFIDFPSWADIVYGSPAENMTYTDTGLSASPNSDPIYSFSASSPTLKLSDSSLSLQVGGCASLSANLPSTWSVDDPTVVGLSSTSGTSVTLTALKAGSATLTATYQSGETTLEATCLITVLEADAPPASTSDTLDRAFTGVTGTSYSEWTKVTESGVTYVGQSAGGNSSIQLRSSNSNSGIVKTSLPKTPIRISVEWNSSTSSGRTIDIYGSENAYMSPADLYASSTRGTKLGSIVCGTSTSLDLTGDYPYIGIRSNSGALYLTSITIDYASDVAPSISATANRTFEVGDVVTASDIKVVDQDGKDVADFASPAIGHRFTYEEVAPGGSATSLIFPVTKSDLSTEVTLSVSRPAYVEPVGETKTLTASDCASWPNSSSTASSGTFAFGDATLAYANGYVYNASMISFGKSSAGKLESSTPFPKDLSSIAVSYSSSSPQGNLLVSQDGTTYVDYSEATLSEGGYCYFRLTYEGMTLSSYTNIVSIAFTFRAEETAENLAHYLMFEDIEGQCSSKLDQAIAVYNDLPDAEKERFASSSDYVLSSARARFSAWLAARGQHIDASLSVVSLALPKEQAESSFALLALLALLGVAGIFGLLLASRRKQ